MQVKHAVKSGLAAALALGTFEALGWQRAPWAAATAVVVMQSNLGGAFAASLQRVLGTALGGLAGSLLAAGLGPDRLGPWLAPLGMGAGVTAAVLACSALRIPDAYRVAGFTVVLIFLAEGNHPWLTGAERFRDVAVGIVAALVVTVGVWPARARHDFLAGLARVLTECAGVYARAVDAVLGDKPAAPAPEGPHQTIRDTIRASYQLLKDMRTEPRSRNLENGALVAVLATLERIHGETYALERVRRGPVVDALCRELAGPLGELKRQTLEAFARLAEALPRGPGPVELPDLGKAVAALQTRFEEGHATPTFTGQALPDWFNVFSFYGALRGVANDLLSVGKRLEGLA